MDNAKNLATKLNADRHIFKRSNIHGSVLYVYFETNNKYGKPIALDQVVYRHPFHNRRYILDTEWRYFLTKIHII